MGVVRKQLGIGGIACCHSQRCSTVQYEERKNDRGQGAPPSGKFLTHPINAKETPLCI